MTPKEKAQDLENKFNLPTGLMSRERKQCALIAVDEIIDIQRHQADWTLTYWNEVKQEINKL